MTMRRALVLLATVIATPAAAQQDMSRVEIKVERVAPGVAVLFGAGGNIGLSYGEDGNVIIDDQYAPLAPRIAAAVNEPSSYTATKRRIRSRVSIT